MAFKNISDVYVDPSWNGVQFPHITEMKKWFVENGWMDGWMNLKNACVCNKFPPPPNSFFHFLYSR